MRILIAAALVAAALPAGAAAATPKIQYYIPPGNSAANEYVEGVPTATGSTSTNRIASHQNGGSTSTSSGVGDNSAVAPATQRALVHQGPDGARAAALARATAPANLRGRRHHGRVATVVPAKPAGPSGGGGSGGGGGASPVGSVARALTGSGISGGLGTALPVALALAAVGVAGVALNRRRSGASSSSS